LRVDGIFRSASRRSFCSAGKYLIINDLQCLKNYVEAVGNMYKIRIRLLFYACFCLWLTAPAMGVQSGGAIAVRAIAEIEQGAKLVPAKRVVSGDRVLYTLEVRNTGATTAAPPQVDYAIPAHTWYVVESAVGPGTEITFSVDGGLNFDRPENLRVPGAEGEMRGAVAADYTHIRWLLKNSLIAYSVAFVRFRVLVK
jgi:uncharacterized repeat protein (TIGR01451 family)